MNMMTELNHIVAELEEELIGIRRDIHKYPEIGFEEKETSQKIIHTLKKHGCTQLRSEIVGTGVLCTIQGAEPGPVIALRVDIDALSNCNDECRKNYASVKKDICHACGHDVHTTIGLGVAAVMQQFKGRFKGTAEIFFQPSEELPKKIDPTLEYDGFTEPPVGYRAAYLAREEGVLESPHVDRLLGIHCWPQLNVGCVGYQYGVAMAGTGNFHISILGKHGHAGTPHKTVDAIILAAQVVMSLQTVVSRKIDPSLPVVLTIGAIKGGSRRSSVAGLVDINGTVRCFDQKAISEDIPQAMESIIKGICIGGGGDYKFEYGVDQPPVINNDIVVQESAQSLKSILGNNVIELRDAPMTAEDFSWLAEGIPAVYLKLGTAGSDEDTQYPLHNPKFDVDEGCIKTGVLAIAKTMLDYLGTI